MKKNKGKKVKKMKGVIGGGTNITRAGWTVSLENTNLTTGREGRNCKLPMRNAIKGDLLQRIVNLIAY